MIVENVLRVAADARGGVTSLGHVFREGDVPAGEMLAAQLGESPLPVQMDVLASWPDGSVKHAVLSFRTPEGIEPGDYALVLSIAEPETAEPPPPAPAPGPALGPETDGGTETELPIENDGLPVDTPEPPPSPAPLDVREMIAAQEYAFEVEIDGEVFEVADLLATSEDDPWLAGPIAAQTRVTAQTANGLELRFDVTAAADGTIRTSLTVANDNIETTGLEAKTYSYAIRQNGVEMLADDALTQPHFTIWREAFTTAPEAVDAHLVYDIGYLRETGLLPSIDETLPLADANAYAATLDDPNATFGPLELGGIDNRGGIDGDRGRTGETPSYGLLTDDQHSYLVTQTAETRAATLALADQYGAYSNYYRNPETGEAYLLEDVDFNSFRTGTGKDVTGTGGIVDLDNDGLAGRNRGSHDPSEYYVAYLVTGERYYAEGLAHEADAAQLLWANASYLTERGAVDFNAQLREQTWYIRDVFYAASIAPDGSHAEAVLEARLDGILQDYLDYYVNDDAVLLNRLGRPLPAARSEARFTDGELSGVLQSYNGTAIDRPYWQDWFGMLLGQIAATGNEKATALGEWMTNFSAGRFLQDDFDPNHNLYSISGYPGSGGSRDLPEETSWADLDAYALTVGGAGEDVNPWHAATNYAAAAWGGTASLFSGIRDPRYAEALLWMSGELTDDYVEEQMLSGVSAQFSLPVVFADGSTAGIMARINGSDEGEAISDGDGNAIINAGAGDDVVITGAGAHLVEGGEGADRLTGGAGEDWLFGGSGEDVLNGGAGLNYLQGDRHDADFGRFADSFEFRETLGETVIGDFTLGQDVLVLSGFGLEGNPLDRFEASEDGARLDLGEAGTLELRGVDLEALRMAGLVTREDALEDGGAVLQSFAGAALISDQLTEADGDILTSTFNEAGIRTGFTFEDGSDSRGWAEYTDQYDPTGALVLRTTILDNGTIRSKSFNDDVLTQRRVTETDGDVRVTTFNTEGALARFVFEDGSDSRSWTRYTNDYDETGARAAQERLFDDGRVLLRKFTDGSLTERRVTDVDGDIRTLILRTDGTRESFTFEDVSDTRPWESFTDSYDDDGVLIEREFVFDDAL